MRIGIDIRMLGNSNGGIGRYVFELAKNILELDKNNNYYLFFNTSNSLPEEVDFFAKFPNAALVRTVFRHYSFGEQTLFLKLLNSFNLDLVHFPNFNTPVFYKKPFVVTIHDMVHHKIGGSKKSHFLHFLAYKQVIKTAAKKASAIITVSEYSKNDISYFLNVPKNKIKVIYEGTSLPTEVAPENVAKVKEKFLLKKPFLLFVGVLERKKNLVSLTRGLDVLIKKYQHDIDLVVVGKTDRHYPEIKYKALDITYNDHLVFTGYVSDKDLAALYKGAHSFVSASLHEGFGLPGIEAMKFGLPLAVSNIGVFNEIYDDAAIYFNPLDPDDIAEKLHLLIKDAQFHQQLQKKSFRRGQLFDWQKAAAETLAVYNSVIGNNNDSNS